MWLHYFLFVYNYVHITLSTICVGVLIHLANNFFRDKTLYSDIVGDFIPAVLPDTMFHSLYDHTYVILFILKIVFNFSNHVFKYIFSYSYIVVVHTI